MEYTIRVHRRTAMSDKVSGMVTEVMGEQQKLVVVEDMATVTVKEELTKEQIAEHEAGLLKELQPLFKDAGGSVDKVELVPVEQTKPLAGNI